MQSPSGPKDMTFIPAPEGIAQTVRKACDSSRASVVLDVLLEETSDASTRARWLASSGGESGAWLNVSVSYCC